MPKLSWNQVLDAFIDDSEVVYNTDLAVAHARNNVEKIKQALVANPNMQPPSVIVASIEAQLQLFRAKNQRNGIKIEVKL